MAAVGRLLLHRGVYGFTIFLVTPVLLGALAAWVFRPRSAGSAAGLGASVATLAAFTLLLTGVEGAICIAMCIPLIARRRLWCLGRL